jgi:hypothetical protein
MKASTLLLAGSVVLNAALVIGVWQHHESDASPAAYRPTPGAAAHVAVSKGSATGSVQGVAGAAADGKATPTLWAQIDDADFGRLADHLREAGFPPAEARAILRQVLQQRREQQRDAIAGKREDVPYWRSPWSTPPDRQVDLKLRAMYTEDARLQNKYIDTPESLEYDDDARSQARQRYGDLPLEKLKRLKAIDNEFMDGIMTALADKSGPQSPKQLAEQQAQLERQKADAARQALTPEEFQQWQLRNSAAANALRFQLEPFRPTEDEYKAIFAVYQSIDQQFPAGSTPDVFTARRNALDQAQPQLEVTLGKQRYAEYQQAVRSGNDMLTRLMVRLDLPLTKVGEVNGVRDDITQRASAIRGNTQLSSVDREAQLAALAQEAQQKITASIGERGFNAYRGMKGDWISALTAKPKK